MGASIYPEERSHEGSGDLRDDYLRGAFQILLCSEVVKKFGTESDLSSRAAEAWSREATEGRRTAKELKMRSSSRSPRDARAVLAAARVIFPHWFQHSLRNLRSFAVLRRSVASRLQAWRLWMTARLVCAISSPRIGMNRQ